MKTLTQLISLVLLLSLSCCNPDSSIDCPERRTFTNEITGAEKAKVPYTGFDTLTFVRAGGDTHTFIGTGKNAGYATASAYSGDPECPDDIAKLEYVNYRFASTTFADPINLSIYIRRHAEVTPNIETKFKTQRFIQGTHILGKNYLYLEKRILGKTYYNLNYISDFNNAADTSFYILYSLNYGIVQFKFPNGEYWELLDKR